MRGRCPAMKIVGVFSFAAQIAAGAKLATPGPWLPTTTPGLPVGHESAGLLMVRRDHAPAARVGGEKHGDEARIGNAEKGFEAFGFHEFQHSVVNEHGHRRTPCGVVLS
jgi:hypothetical protein